MGNGNSVPLTKRVQAPKKLKSGEKFVAENWGATWKDLQVPKELDIVQEGEWFDAIVDQNIVTVNIKAQQDAQEGNQFKAGRSPWTWIVDEAPKGGVKTNEFYDIELDNIRFKKLIVFEANENQMKIPDKAFTGVEKNVTQICATMAAQIYKAGHKKDFKLTADGEDEYKVVLLDNHRAQNPTIPAFAVGIVERTMILCWRGTNAGGSKANAVFDLISDFAIGPTMCHLLGKAASGIRMQNAMHSFASLELEVHGDHIISLITEHNIEEIVFTGHSLGGGIAQCAHPILQAQMDGLNESPSAQKWTKLGGNITLRTLVFSAVQSVLGKGLVLDPKGNNIVNQDSDDLLDKVGETTVNLVYGTDIIPRGYSHLSYIGEVVDKVKEEGRQIAREKSKALGLLPINYRERIQRVIDIAEQDVIGVLKDFRHQGKVLFYKDEAATKEDPKVFTHDQFDEVTYESFGVTKTGTRRIMMMLDAHSKPHNLLASYVSYRVDDIEKAEDKYESSSLEEPAAKKQKTIG